MGAPTTERNNIVLFNNGAYADSMAIGCRPDNPVWFEITRSEDQQGDHEAMPVTVRVIAAYTAPHAPIHAHPWFDMVERKLMIADDAQQNWIEADTVRAAFTATAALNQVGDVNIHSSDIPLGGGSGGTVGGPAGTIVGSGTTADRGTTVSTFRYNEDTGRFEGLTPEGWVIFGEDNFSNYQKFSVTAATMVFPSDNTPAAPASIEQDGGFQVVHFSGVQAAGFNYYEEGAQNIYVSPSYKGSGTAQLYMRPYSGTWQAIGDAVDLTQTDVYKRTVIEAPVTKYDGLCQFMLVINGEAYVAEYVVLVA